MLSSTRCWFLAFGKACDPRHGTRPRTRWNTDTHAAASYSTWGCFGERHGNTRISPRRPIALSPAVVVQSAADMRNLGGLFPGGMPLAHMLWDLLIIGGLALIRVPINYGRLLEQGMKSWRTPVHQPALDCFLPPCHGRALLTAFYTGSPDHDVFSSASRAAEGCQPKHANLSTIASSSGWCPPLGVLALRYRGRVWLVFRPMFPFLGQLSTNPVPPRSWRKMAEALEIEAPNCLQPDARWRCRNRGCGWPGCSGSWTGLP